MIHLIRTDSTNLGFIKLVRMLDEELAIIDGDDHDFYDQYNGISDIKYAVVAFEDDLPVSCGAIKPIDEKTVEVKRMYTTPAVRGKGVASKVLAELEAWASEMSFTQIILETGKRQKDAVRLYEKNGYSVIANYPPYVGVENSVCFKKVLS
ncbi:MAG: GNAT family N-acetyltransferase [Cyclobacteriaceae bacterium]